MSQEDRVRWDAHYAGRSHERRDPEAAQALEPPTLFGDARDLFPSEGRALDVACGDGLHSLWLAERGLEVFGVDVSPTAIELARSRAKQRGLGDRCHFDVLDLDQGLPPGPPVELVLCHLFRDPRLYRPMVERVVPGGLLAVAVLSEVGAQPGRFRARADELREAFAGLCILRQGEEHGHAWILARHPE